MIGGIVNDVKNMNDTIQYDIEHKFTMQNETSQ